MCEFNFYATKLAVYNFNLPEDCITFNIYDSYGDGILGGGGVSLIDSNDIEIYPYNGNYGDGDTKPFNSDGILGSDELDYNSISIYPNPARDVINILNAETTDIEVYDILGRLIISKDNISSHEQINISHLNSGTYFIKIFNGTHFINKKFIVNK